MKKGGGAGKGGSYERLIAREFSLWWSNCTRDDIFYRTSGSGMRATARTKVGKSTFGQYGDLQAIDPVGQPFIDLCCVELKSGYKSWDALEIVDHSAGKTKFQLLDFIVQAERQADEAGVDWPLLVLKRDFHLPFIMMCRNMYETIRDWNENCGLPIHPTGPVLTLIPETGTTYVIVGMHAFFGWAVPRVFVELAE